MHDLLTFALAVLALLATPGPTNTLLAASGATAGLRWSLRLVPYEIAGYVLSIAVLTIVVGPLVAGHPAFSAALRLAAAAYLSWSAVVLWRSAADSFAHAPRPVTPLRVFVTTLLNPKALVFAFAVFPALPLPEIAPYAALFLSAVVVVGTGWIIVGRVLVRSAGSTATPRLVTRVSAIVLAVFATLIAGTAVAAAL